MLGEGPEGFLGVGGVDGGVDEAESGEDAGDVAIEDGGAGVVGDGGDGTGGVSADPRELQQVGDVVGDVAGVVGDDGFGGGVEVAGAAVVAQALPEGEYFLFVGVGEVLDGGAGGDEAGEVGQDGGDLGLLEHGFADQGVVGVGGLAGFGAPGEVAAVDVVPGEEASAEGGGLAVEAGRGVAGVGGGLCGGHGG